MVETSLLNRYPTLSIKTSTIIFSGRRRQVCANQNACKHICTNKADNIAQRHNEIELWFDSRGAYLMKKDAAVDEEGEADALVMGTGRPAWLGPFSLQGVKDVVVV